MLSVICTPLHMRLGLPSPSFRLSLSLCLCLLPHSVFCLPLSLRLSHSVSASGFLPLLTPSSVFPSLTPSSVSLSLFHSPSLRLSLCLLFLSLSLSHPVYCLSLPPCPSLTLSLSLPLSLTVFLHHRSHQSAVLDWPPGCADAHWPCEGIQ